MSSAVHLSVVVPAFNEGESLPELVQELDQLLAGQPYASEILVVDDGSHDGTERALESLAERFPRLRAVSLRRNFGKSAALATGFRQARGQWVMTMDADLQDDPAELPRLAQALEGGLDLVAGVKLHDFNCGLKLYRRAVVEELEIYGELHRFIPALAHWRGFRVGEIPVRHRARRYGRSKFGASRFINGFLDLIAASFVYTSALKPLHVFGRIGLLFMAGGAAIGVYFVVLWAGGEPIRVRPLMLFGAGLVFLGLQLLLMGLLGEMIASQRARSDYPLRRAYPADPA